MELLPFQFQELCVPRDQLFRAFHVPIGDRTNDLDRVMFREFDLHDGTGFRDMHMRRRVIERLDPDLESCLANQRRHCSLGYLRP
jgi:hypothetical protein